MSKKKLRTCIRLTLVKDWNMSDLQGYADLIKIANPDFIEIKAYMHVGASRERLNRENMPSHAEVVEFSRQLNNLLEDYQLISEHQPSRVTLLANKKFKIKNKWYTWIDFDKFIKLANSKKSFSTKDYMKETPKGLIGITKNNSNTKQDELDLW